MSFNWRDYGLNFEEMLVDSNTREGGLYKWALVGSQYRFIRYIYSENHGMLVNDGEAASDAGTISVNSDFHRVMDHGSSTLKVGCSSQAEENLNKLLEDASRPFRERMKL
jgi:hypothetical protein